MYELFAYLEAREDAGEAPPSYVEMMAHLQTKSRHTVARALNELQQQQKITRKPRGKRKIMLVRPRSEYERGKRDGYAEAYRELRGVQ